MADLKVKFARCAAIAFIAFQYVCCDLHHHIACAVIAQTLPLYLFFTFTSGGSQPTFSHWKDAEMHKGKSAFSCA